MEREKKQGKEMVKKDTVVVRKKKKEDDPEEKQDWSSCLSNKIALSSPIFFFSPKFCLPGWIPRKS